MFVESEAYTLNIPSKRYLKYSMNCKITEMLKHKAQTPKAKFEPILLLLEPGIGRLALNSNSVKPSHNLVCPGLET